MRTASAILLSSAAVAGLIALAPARAAAPVTIEKSLLGIRILQSYKDVLAKWGPPRLIARGDEVIIYTPVLDPEGNDLGGIRGISYTGGTSGGAGGGSGPSSGGGMGGKGGGGTPRMPGTGQGKMGPSSGGGSPAGGGGGGAGADSDVSFGQAGSYMWAYHDARHQDFYLFYFNLEGRVVFVEERGREGGMPTQRGIKLGSSVKSLYETYGWPDTIQEIEPGIVMDYGSKYHVKFAVIKDRVVGIGVVLEESQAIPFFPLNSSGGAGGGKGGMAGGTGPQSGGAGGGGRKGGGGGAD